MRLSQLNEGPCDVATKDDISHMTADEYAKYSKWKADCEDEHRRTPESGKRFADNEKSFRRSMNAEAKDMVPYFIEAVGKCKYCGCQIDNPDTGCDCKYDSHDASGDNWVKEETVNEDHDIGLLKAVARQMEADAHKGDYTAIEELLQDVSEEELKAFLSDHRSPDWGNESVKEATHGEAKPIYDLVGSLGAGEIKLAQNPIFQDLVRFLDADTINKFVTDFRNKMAKDKDFRGSVDFGQYKEDQNESIYAKNKEDPMNPEVLIQGYGRLMLNQIEDDLVRKFNALKDMATKKDWDNIDYQLNRTGVIQAFIKAITDTYNELEQIRRRGGMNSRGIKQR